jgi:hypothetical protein
MIVKRVTEPCFLVSDLLVDFRFFKEYIMSCLALAFALLIASHCAFLTAEDAGELRERGIAALKESQSNPRADLGASDCAYSVLNNPANPATTDVEMTFTANATDADGDALDYTWDFGDGTTRTGVSVAKVYSTAGVYVVKVVVSDGQASDVQSINLIVNDQTPAGTFAVSKVNLSFNFRKSASDRLTISGQIPIPAGVNLAGRGVRVLIGGLDKTYTLTSKGASTDKAFILNGKPKIGASAFTIALTKQSLFMQLNELGLSKTKNNPSLAVPVVIVLDGVRYVDNPIIDYEVKNNKNGPVRGTGTK